jgi:mgtE-like transporter
MSTVDDIVVTVSYVMVVGLTFLPGLLAAMIAAVAVAGGILLIVYVRHRHERVFMKTLTEGGPVVMLSSLLASIGGVGLSSLRDEIERHPSVLMLYPALIDALGDIGSILGSMETTRLALGFVSSYGAALREAFADLVSIEAAAALMHVFFGVAAFLLGRATGLSSNAGQLVATSLVTNLISFLLVSLLSLAVATQTFKRGLDPDNFVIPLVTSVADTGATLALMAALIIVG